jgi:predicted nucleic acid-binding protein
MKIIIDNNILFSLMNPCSISSYLLASSQLEIFAPEFINLELDKYKEECLAKSGLSEQEFEIRLSEIKDLIEFIELSKYEDFLLRSINNIEDPKDAPYLALALSLNIPIWSNDPHLIKQTLIEVLTTGKLVELFINGII